MSKKILVSVGLECSINFFSLVSGKLLKSIKNAHEDIIQDILPLRKGVNEDEFVVTCSTDDTNRMHLWDLDTMNVRMSYEDEHRDGLKCLCHTPNRRDLFASGSWDSEIRIWNLDEAKSKFCLTGHTAVINEMTCFAFHLASCSNDRTVKIWDFQNQSCLQTIRQTSPIQCVAASNDCLFTSSKGILVLWDSEYKSQKCLQINEKITAMTYFPDKFLLVAGDQKGRLLGWDIRKGGSKNPFLFVKKIHKGAIKKIKEFQNAQNQPYLISCSYDKTIQISEASPPKKGIDKLLGFFTQSSSTSQNSNKIICGKNRIHSICLLEVSPLYDQEIKNSENFRTQRKKIFEKIKEISKKSKYITKDIIKFTDFNSSSIHESIISFFLGKSLFHIILSLPNTDTSSSTSNTEKSENFQCFNIFGLLDTEHTKFHSSLNPIIEEIESKKEFEENLDKFRFFYHRNLFSFLGVTKLRDSFFGSLYFSENILSGKTKIHVLQIPEFLESYFRKFENFNLLGITKSDEGKKVKELEIEGEGERDEEVVVETDDEKKKKNIVITDNTLCSSVSESFENLENIEEFRNLIIWFLEKWFIAKKIILSVFYLHEIRGIAHGNLVPSNIMVVCRNSEFMEIKIKGYINNNKSSEPEKEKSKFEDIRFLGILLILIFFNKNYFSKSNSNIDITELPNTSKLKFLFDNNGGEILGNLKNLISSCLEKELEKRIKIGEIKNRRIWEFENSLFEYFLKSKYFEDLKNFKIDGFSILRNSLICPITKEKMKNCCDLEQSGFSYERKAIEKFLKISNFDPISDILISTKKMTENKFVNYLLHSFE